MELITSLSEGNRPCSVALGFFDGVHLAHAQVIRAAVAAAGGKGAIPSVLSFRTQKGRLVNKGNSGYILDEGQKLERFQKLGVEQVFLPEFSDLAQMEAEDFVEDILFARLQARVVACGYDYSFGKDARGRVELLQNCCERAGVTCIVLPQYRLDGEPVSSSRIRDCLLAGEIPQANRLLGYAYEITGPVIHGRSLGRTLGFPTLNQAFSPDRLVPRFGVYNSTTVIEGRVYDSITNIGVKPTIEGVRAPLAETYLLDADGDFYGAFARVTLLELTRPERKFESLEELKQTVHRDIRAREQRRLLDQAEPLGRKG